MSSRNFREMLEAKWAEGKFVCVGLDPDWDKIPECIKTRKTGRFSPRAGSSSVEGLLYAFCTSIVDATHDLVCAYKPNAAFFEEESAEGGYALDGVIRYINKLAPDVPVIYDAKRGDIGNTNKGYVQDAFGTLKADAITVHPYLGREALQPFLDQKDKGIIVLCRTSNKGADEFQDLVTLDKVGAGSFRLYERVAWQVSQHWNGNGNCALVAGATYPEELERVRHIVGDMPILIPGIGAQGGDLEATVKAGMDSRGKGMIINSSRGIIFASSEEDFAEAARRETLKLHEAINAVREKGKA